MNDQFLNDHYQQPRPEFVQALAQRLYTLHPVERRRAFPMRLAPAACAALILLVALGLTLAISPAARAQMLTIYREVGGLLFDETGDYPGKGEPVEIIPSQVLTLDEARQAFPTAFGLPAWVPEGYSISPELMMTEFKEAGFVQLMVVYRKTEPFTTAVSLHIKHMLEEKELKQLVGPGSVEEVTVNDQPAALVRGVWDSQAQRWGLTEHLTLSWKHGSLTYELSSAYVALEDLIRMAESIE